MKRLILVCCLMGLRVVTSAPAQSRPATLTSEAVSSGMDQIRRGVIRGRDGREVFAERSSWKITDDMLRAEDPQIALNLFEPYVKDSSSTVRRMAYTLLRRTAELHATPPVRQRVVETLLEERIRHPEEVDSALSVFQREADFSPAAKDVIRREMAGDGLRPIDLCGVAQLRDQLPRLGDLLIDETQPTDPGRPIAYRWATEGWRARLARARMGVQEDVQRCIALVDSEPDEKLRVKHLLADVAYIRQPEAIRYLQKYLDSDKRFPDDYGVFEGYMRGEAYAHVALRLLRQCLEGFPPGNKYVRTWQDVLEAREWMAQQTQWHIIR